MDKMINEVEQKILEELAQMRLRLAKLEDLAVRSGRMKRELLEREARLTAMISAFDGPIYICSKDFRVEYMNETLVRRSGRDATGDLCYRVLHDRDSVCPWCVNERVFAGETVKWEIQSPKDKRWYYVVDTPLYHADGTMSKQAIITDITDRKRAEESLKQAYEALELLAQERTSQLASTIEILNKDVMERRQAEESLKHSRESLKLSEEKYRMLVENINDVIYTLDAEGRFTYVSPVIERFSGYRVKDLLGRPFMEFVHPEDLPGLLASFERTVAGNMEPYEFRVLDRDGSIRFVRTSSRLIREGGRVTGLTAVMTDITERKRAEEDWIRRHETLEDQLRKAQAELEKARGEPPGTSRKKFRGK